MILKPCPLCGGEAKYDAGGTPEWGGHDHQSASIECVNCGCEVWSEVPCSCCHSITDDVVAKWNNRPKAKMSNEQYLLTKLSEECNEVGQMASKCQQFGLDEVYDGDGNILTNRQRLHAEMNDLLGVIDMLNAEEDFDFVPDPIAHLHKRAKIAKYRQYSINLGFVEEIKDATNK